MPRYHCQSLLPSQAHLSPYRRLAACTSISVLLQCGNKSYEKGLRTECSYLNVVWCFVEDIREQEKTLLKKELPSKSSKTSTLLLIFLKRAKIMPSLDRKSYPWFFAIANVVFLFIEHHKSQHIFKLKFWGNKPDNTGKVRLLRGQGQVII